MVDQLEITERTETRTCDKHGDYEVKVMHILGSDRDMGYCEQCHEIQQAEEAAKEKRRMTAMASDLSRRILPPRFHGCDFGGYRAETDGQRRALAICQKYANRWDDRKAKGGCLVLCGNPGTGKTHLAAAIVKAILPTEIEPRGFSETNHPIIYTTATAMTRKIKATYGRDAQETEQEVINRLSSVALLVVDEVGAQRGTETELLLIQEVIDNRYQRMLPTILISNLQESELSEYIGERALDRLYDNGGAVVGFDWGSKRRV
jgi:DNA replication protein DnaC